MQVTAEIKLSEKQTRSNLPAPNLKRQIWQGTPREFSSSKLCEKAAAERISKRMASAPPVNKTSTQTKLKFQIIPYWFAGRNIQKGRFKSKYGECFVVFMPPFLLGFSVIAQILFTLMKYQTRLNSTETINCKTGKPQYTRILSKCEK